MHSRRRGKQVGSKCDFFLYLCVLSQVLPERLPPVPPTKNEAAWSVHLLTLHGPVRQWACFVSPEMGFRGHRICREKTARILLSGLTNNTSPLLASVLEGASTPASLSLLPASALSPGSLKSTKNYCIVVLVYVSSVAIDFECFFLPLFNLEFSLLYSGCILIFPWWFLSLN